MILSKAVSNKKKIYILKLLKLIKFLNHSKIHKRQIKNLSGFLTKNSAKPFTYNKVNKVKNQNVVNYIINVILSPTNTVVNVTDISGNVVVSISAGLINLTKFQKKSQPTAVINIFKFLMMKAQFLQNKTVSLHFKNVKRFHESLIISVLKRFFLIKSFQSYNLSPHNGCRPKKIKRVKRRTKRLVLK